MLPEWHRAYEQNYQLQYDKAIDMCSFIESTIFQDVPRGLIRNRLLAEAACDYLVIINKQILLIAPVLIEIPF